MNVYADTHVVVWLGQGQPDKLGTAAQRAIDENDLLVSPAVVLELELLHEIGRLRTTASKLIATLVEEIGLRVCELSFRIVVQFAVKENWGRDPFDRLIVAHAKAAGAPLVTKDRKMHDHYTRAVW